MPIVLKSESLNLLKPTGPVQACNGIALPLFCFAKCRNSLWHYHYKYFETEVNTLYQFGENFNPLNPELNPICYFLALLAHHFLHVSRIRVKSLTFSF